MTRCRQTFLLLFLLLLAALAPAQRREAVVQIAGGDIGKTTYQQNSDGSFTSEMNMSVAGTTITSTLTGKVVDGVLVSYTLKQNMGDKSMQVVAENGVAKTTVDGKEEEEKYTPTKRWFANYHFFTYENLRPAGLEPESFKGVILDGAAELDLKVAAKAARVVEAGGAKRVVNVFQLFIETLECEVFTTEAGSFVAVNVPSQRFTSYMDGYGDLLADPSTKFKELSQPTHPVKSTKKVMIPMRDGVELAADIAMPSEAGKWPVILVRTPYGRAMSMIDADWYAKRGYVFMAQDVRGRGDSKGDWRPLFNERKDGKDTLDWIAKQPWCNGNIGMIGGSYLGYVQWCAAVEKHPALKCIIPQVSPPDPFFNFPWDHGVPFIFGAVWWARAVSTETISASILAPVTKPDSFLLLPLAKIDDAMLGADVPWINDWWTRNTWSAWAGANYLKELKNVNIPALQVSGWWDGDGIGTKINYAAMRAKPNQYLIYGPWTHFFNTSSKMGDVDYGSSAIIDLNTICLRWFDRWLKDQPVLGPVPKVQVFVTGANEWRSLTDWPDPKSKEATLYLTSPGPSNGDTSMGALSWNKPGDEEPDRYTYNPAAAKMDKEDIEIDLDKATTVVKAEDVTQEVLVYKTGPLAEPMDIGGPLALDLYFSSSAVDTDFYAAIVDIDPKGVMRVIGIPGKIRAQYRKSWDKPELLSPGKVERMTVDLWDVAHRFQKGHRLGLMISSDSFPSYARNLGTGEPPATATRMVAASQAVYHDAKRPTALRFRLLPK